MVMLLIGERPRPHRRPGGEGAAARPRRPHGHSMEAEARDIISSASVPNVRARRTWPKLSAGASLPSAVLIPGDPACEPAAIHPGSTDVRARYQRDFRTYATRAASRGVRLGRSAAASLALYHQRHPRGNSVRHRIMPGAAAAPHSAMPRRRCSMRICAVAFLPSMPRQPTAMRKSSSAAVTRGHRSIRSMH